MKEQPDHTLEFLLAFNGRIHYLERGYWIKFEIERVEATRHRPTAYPIRLRSTPAAAGVLLVSTMLMGSIRRVLDLSVVRWPAITGTAPKTIRDDHTSSKTQIRCCRISLLKFGEFSRSEEFPKWLSKLKKESDG